MHHVIDEWFEKVVKPKCVGEVIICRYADDFVCAFQFPGDAERFYKVLPKGLEKLNFQVAPEKTNLMEFSRFQPVLKNRFAFLGFEFYCKKDKGSIARVFRRTAREKLQKIKNNYSEFIKSARHERTPILIDKLTQKLRGHYNYFGAVGNQDDLYTVYIHSVGLLYKWLNRRSGCKSMNWAKLKCLLAYRSQAKPVCKVIKWSKKVWL